MKDYKAARELQRIAQSSAFSIVGYSARQKLNQHSVLYRFPDGSNLQIDATSRRASCWHNEWHGTESDIALGPIANLPICINRSA